MLAVGMPLSNSVASSLSIAIGIATTSGYGTFFSDSGEVVFLTAA